MWNLKKNSANELIYKTEIESQIQNKLMVSKGKKGGEINWETLIDIYSLLYIKQITNEDLPYSTGNPSQYSIVNYMGKESRKWLYV